MWPELTHQLSDAKSFLVEKEGRKLSDDWALIIHDTYISLEMKFATFPAHLSLAGIDSFHPIINWFYS